MADIKTLVEEARGRVREEFRYVANAGPRACLDSAMLNVDALVSALAEAHQADVARLTRGNEGLAKINAELLDQMHHFANADQRLWDESQRDPESFIRWVRSRAAHLLAKFTARNPGACSVTDGEAKK